MMSHPQYFAQFDNEELRALHNTMKSSSKTDKTHWYALDMLESEMKRRGIYGNLSQDSNAVQA